MRTLTLGIVGALTLAATVSTTLAPAFALGACGPNGHRNGYGRCVFGGQNQAYCLRTKGHPAVRMPDGTLRCI